MEFKKSENSFPISALETYSAMANTSGGLLVLGIAETKDGIVPTGITNPSKVKREMFNLLNDPNKVNKNILTNEDVKEFRMPTGETIIFVNIPEASYSEKPIYLDGNYKRSYKRNHEGDYLCTENEMKIMIRDASPESFDSAPLSNYSINDLDAETIRRYRSIFKN